MCLTQITIQVYNKISCNARTLAILLIISRQTCLILFALVTHIVYFYYFRDKSASIIKRCQTNKNAMKQMCGTDLPSGLDLIIGKAITSRVLDFQCRLDDTLELIYDLICRQNRPTLLYFTNFFEHTYVNVSLSVVFTRYAII